MKVTQFLGDQGVQFDAIQHRDTFDAQHMASAVHVPGREVAKTVLLSVDHGHMTSFVVATLPATKMVDLAKVANALGHGDVALASESEIARRCPDCEIGAVPPFGSQYGMKTLVDESLTSDEEIVFESNSHHEAIRMRYRDFEKIEKPWICSISVD